MGRRKDRASPAGIPAPQHIAPQAPTAAIVAALLAVLSLSVAGPFLASEWPALWGLAPWSAMDGAVLLRTGAVAAAVTGGLGILGGRGMGRWGRARALRTLLVLVAMAAVFDFAGPVTHTGDWQQILWVAGEGEVIGKWHGAGLLYGLFHRLARAVAGMTVLESVRLFSSVCGALTAWMYSLIVGEFRLPAVLPGWPFLYLGSFGAVGVGLAHVEIYAPVALALGFMIWAGLRAIRAPSVRSIALFSVSAGAAFSLYVGLLIFVPVWLCLVAVAVARLLHAGSSRDALRASACGLLAPVLFLVFEVAGPRASDQPLLSLLWSQFASGANGGSATRSGFHPPEVYWNIFPSLMAPSYWFSSWHMRDLFCHSYLNDRMGVILALGLTAVAIWRSARRGRLDPPEPGLLVPAAAVAVSLPYSFTVVSGLLYPWDWDLCAHLTLATSVLSAALLAAFSGGRPYGWPIRTLVAIGGTLSLLSGMMFLQERARSPVAFGPRVRGLQVAVVPQRFELDGSIQYAHFWLRNFSDRPLHFSNGQSLIYQLAGAYEGQWLVEIPQRRSLLGQRDAAPGSAVCLFFKSVVPTPLLIVPVSEGSTREGARFSRPWQGIGPPGLHRMHWLFWITPEGETEEIELQSNDVEVLIPPDEAGSRKE